MKTIVLKINSKNPEINKIKKAALILKKGGLVAFPTDTVYGLGADALNPEAVKKIFAVKRRPRVNPLPILINKKNDLSKYALHIPQKIKRLIDKFWPGPLTLTFRKKKIIPDVVTANKKTVGIRAPNNLVALALIRAMGKPIAATSANLHGRPSPVTADEVRKNLNNKIDLILDGGKTKLGIESTILGCAATPPTLLRLGAIKTETLEKIIGKIKKK